jgi:cysteine desulfurase
MNMQQIYLDYNATTPIAPSVQEAMLPFLCEHYGNPSSTHSLGRAANAAIEDARGRVAAILGADRDEIVFTSGGTEANNLALQGMLLRDVPTKTGHLVTTDIEHPAIIEPAKQLERLGIAVTFVKANSQGIVEPEAIDAALRPDTRLVSVMHANNETGVIQPIRQISEVCHANNVLVHTDAAQTVGKIRTMVGELGVDMLSIAGHKIYAPKGVGALYVNRSVPLEPVIYGAGHERGLRPGTENTPYIVALGQASSLVRKALDESGDRMAMLRDRLLARLRGEIGPRLGLNGQKSERLPNTLSVNFPSVVGADLLARIPELCASTGSACHSGLTRVSPTLAAMGVTPDIAQGTVRLSVGWYTSEEQIDRAAELLIGAWESLVN